jgi:iron complex transport system substrate-binding protein
MQRLRNSASAWLSRLAVLLLAFGTPASARSVVDATGRTAEIPDRIDRVMPAGQPAAVLLYTLAPEKMIGWPHSPSPAAKNLLGPSIAGLPELAPLVRDGKVQAEQIQAARPDVILDYGSTAPRYADRATMVQAATGIPVLLLDGKLERTPEIYRLLGAILGTEERAADLAAAADRLLAITRERAQARREAARPGGVHYVASKGGVLSMTRAMALELAPYRLRVNAIAPGLTDTAQPRYGSGEAELAEAARAIPFGRMARPEEIAHAAVFLASDNARFMTGQTLHVNGGSYFG